MEFELSFYVKFIFSIPFSSQTGLQVFIIYRKFPLDPKPLHSGDGMQKRFEKQGKTCNDC